MSSRQFHPSVALVVIAATLLTLSRVASATRLDARLAQAAYTPVPVPVFGLMPRA